MEKRTLISVVVAVVLGLGAYAALRAPQKGEGRAKAARPVPAMKAADITRLEITTQKDEKTTLEKRGERWMITAPGEWPADAAVVKSLLDGLEKLGFGDLVTEHADKHAQLGVGDTGSVRLKVSAGTATSDFILGQTVGGFAMLRVAGKNEVWQADRLFPYTANKAPKEWREHTIVDGDAKDVDKLSVEVPGGSRIELERDDKSWKLVSSSGDAPKASDALDTSLPSTVCAGLSALRAIDFAEGKAAKDAGLQPPQLILTVEGKSKKQVIEIGAAQGDEVYVRKAGEPTMFLVKKYLLDRVLLRPVDYRDKTLLHYKAAEIARLRVVQGKDETTLVEKSGAFKLASGATDETKAKALVGGVESLIGSSVVTDKTAKTGLDKPRATVRVELKAGGNTTLKIGGLTSDQSEYYAALEGGKDVLLVKKFAIDRLLKKPADLAPGAASPGGPAPPGMPKR